MDDLHRYREILTLARSASGLYFNILPKFWRQNERCSPSLLTPLHLLNDYYTT